MSEITKDQAREIAKVYCGYGDLEEYHVTGDTYPEGSYIREEPKEAFWAVICPRLDNGQWILDGPTRFLLIGKNSAKVLYDDTYQEIG